MSDAFNETIEGGKYLAADGKTFIDAWGKPVKDGPLSRAELEVMAVEAGMSAGDAKKAKNILALIEFIESQTAPTSDQSGEEA